MIVDFLCELYFHSLIKYSAPILIFEAFWFQTFYVKEEKKFKDKEREREKRKKRIYHNEFLHASKKVGNQLLQSLIIYMYM